MPMMPTPSEDVVQYLRSLGWSDEDIAKMGRGPSFHSSEEIASPKVRGVLQTEAPIAGVPRSAAANENFGQAAILGALWASLHGDPSKMLSIVGELTALSAAQQAYLISSWAHAKDAMVSLDEWRSKFHATRDERRRTSSASTRVLDHVAVATLEAAAQAQEEIPLVGESLRSLLEVAIEIREALLWGFPQPINDLAELVAKQEGKGIRRGLAGDETEIDGDAVASLLPEVEPGTTYPFVPRLPEFIESATRLRLYPQQAHNLSLPKLRFRLTIRSARSGQGDVLLGLHGVEGILPEMVVATSDGSKENIRAYLSLSDDIGDLMTGTLRLEEPSGWRVSAVTVVRGSDGMQWQASQLGEPDADGRFRLLTFVELDARGDRDWLLSGDEADEDSEEGDDSPEILNSNDSAGPDSGWSATDNTSGEQTEKRQGSATKGESMKNFQVVSQNPDGTFVVREVESTALAPATNNLPAIGNSGGGFQARIGGRIVTFASEQDYQEAAMAFREMNMPQMDMGNMGNMGNMGMGMGMMNRGRGGGGFLRTGADAAEAITGFFAGRNLRSKRDDLLSAIDAENAAKDKIASFTSKYGDLVPALLDWIASEQAVNASALSVLDDQIYALDMQAGIGVVRTMSDLWDGYNRNAGGGDGAYGAIAVGAIGLGIGFLLSNTGNRAGRRGRRY